jgi:hypothetical protein
MVCTEVESRPVTAVKVERVRNLVF